jgi:hypothetical protein
MFHAFAAAVVSLSMGFGAQPGHPELPQGHPSPDGTPSGHPNITVQENDPDIVEPPEADPADVGSIDAIIGAYYDTLSGPKGEARDWDRLRSLFQPLARLIAARPVAGDRSGIWVMQMEEFIAFNKTYMENGGYFEREVFRKVDGFGNIAQVLSTYESRRIENDPNPYSRGIYSIQLLKDGDRWWIVNVYWDYERGDTPIPEEYLP